MNWAKNDRVRAIFVEEAKILEITIFDILAEILISQYVPNFGAIYPIFKRRQVASILRSVDRSVGPLVSLSVGRSSERDLP